MAEKCKDHAPNDPRRLPDFDVRTVVFPIKIADTGSRCQTPDSVFIHTGKS